ncbi:hypothetical protein MHU86_3659 [Fragilaria crotonensis]|nr:hypothetical protein MHU86_3659 [Fragilaria crotonensis]
MIAAPPPTTRAQDILKDLRQKRELLVSSNPSLQRNALNKPPTVPKAKGVVPSCSSTGSTRAQEILGDMKQKRASLTAVLEACKSTDSPGKKRDRSIGLSTAPTAASTRSWLSSIADDDDSICYSETSRESRRESSIEFIIDTEESDLNSVSTREEVRQAVAAVCNEVVPKVLMAIQKTSSTSSVLSEASKKTTTTTSWTFRTQSSARNLYHEESIKHNRAEKKKRRTKISDRRRQDNSSASTSGSTAPLPIDINLLRSRRAKLQSMLDTILEMKEVSEFNHRLEQTRSYSPQRPRRRPRQDDSSEGRTKKSSNSSIASHYVLDTSTVKDDAKKMTFAKANHAHHALTRDTIKLLPSLESDSEVSLLESPAASDDDESLLVTPDQSQGQLLELPSKPDPRRSRVSTPSKERSTRRQSRRTSSKKSKPPPKMMPMYAQTDRDNDMHPTQNRINTEGDVRRGSQVTSASTSAMSSDPCEPIMGQHNGSRDPLNESRVQFTYDDIVKEMNQMAAKLAKDGLTIPIGAELKLRKGRMLPSDDNSATGWSFSEPSVVSDCSFSMPSKVISDVPEASIVSSHECATKRRSAKTDVSERFCGGLYHLAVLSGMPPCEVEV